MTDRSAVQDKLLNHWFVLSITCLFLWGLWGFMSKLLADRIGATQSQVLFTVGMLPAAVLGAIIAGRQQLIRSVRGVAYGFANGLLTALGTWCFFAALARTSASLVSPVVASYPLVTVALAIVILRERISWRQVAGGMCAVAGLVLLS